MLYRLHPDITCTTKFSIDGTSIILIDVLASTIVHVHVHVLASINLV